MFSANYIEHVPNFMRGHIFDIIEVAPYGNCGFRTVVKMMGINQENWYNVWQVMLTELKQSTNRRHQVVLQGLTVAPKELVLIEKWLSIPDMGHLSHLLTRLFLLQLPKRDATL